MTTKNQLLYIAPEDPWNRWTNSGTPLALITGLQQRGRLFGALSRFAPDLKELKGRSTTRHLMWKIKRRLGKLPKRTLKNTPEGIDERGQPLGQLLPRLPKDTWVLYHYVLPIIDRSLPIKRVLFQDMTVDDAVKSAGFEYNTLTKEEIAVRRKAVVQACFDADAIVSFSSFLIDHMHADYGVPREKIFAIGGGPIRRWDKPVPPELERYKKRHILFCGRAWERKGGPVLLEAFKAVRKEFPEAKLTVVSSGAKNLTDPGVEHIPFASDQKLHELYRTCSLFCMPSISETWGLVYVEAAAHGCPTANWDNWALPDIVVQNHTGVLSSKHNAEGLAEAIIEALRDPKHLMDMGQNAVHRVKTVLDWPHCVDRLLAATMPEALEGRQPVWMKPRTPSTQTRPRPD